MLHNAVQYGTKLLCNTRPVQNRTVQQCSTIQCNAIKYGGYLKTFGLARVCLVFAFFRDKMTESVETTIRTEGWTFAVAAIEIRGFMIIGGIQRIHPTGVLCYRKRKYPTDEANGWAQRMCSRYEKIN